MPGTPLQNLGMSFRFGYPNFMAELGSRLARLPRASLARTITSIRGSARWLTTGSTDRAPYFDEFGTPMLLASDESAAELLHAGTGRVVLDGHPRLGIVELAGQFWSVAGPGAAAALEGVRRDHLECPGCDVWRFTTVIGLQVVTASLRRPGELESRPVPVDDYEAARPDPLLTWGASIAAHVNAAHRGELAALAAALTDQPSSRVVGAAVGAVDGEGFELSVVDATGGAILVVPLPYPVVDPRALPDALHHAIETAVSGRTE